MKLKLLQDVASKALLDQKLGHSKLGGWQGGGFLQRGVVSIGWMY